MLLYGDYYTKKYKKYLFIFIVFRLKLFSTEIEEGNSIAISADDIDYRGTTNGIELQGIDGTGKHILPIGTHTSTTYAYGQIFSSTFYHNNASSYYNDEEQLLASDPITVMGNESPNESPTALANVPPDKKDDMCETYMLSANATDSDGIQLSNILFSTVDNSGTPWVERSRYPAIETMLFNTVSPDSVNSELIYFKILPLSTLKRGDYTGTISVSAFPPFS